MTFENLEEIKKAKSKIVEGALTIWNARLEALVRAGDIRAALNQMISPVEYGDNCDCNGSCGAELLQRELQTQVSRAASK